MTTQKDKLAKWKALTPAQRKVEIAKDAKAQVLASKYTVCSANGYIVPRDVKQYERLLSLVGRKSTKDPVTGYAVNQLASNCELCARGALLLSRIRQFNQLSYEDVGFSRGIAARTHFYSDDDHTEQGLSGAFTFEELCDIEVAFEGWNGSPDWCNDIEADDDRLLAILQNIIDHDGTFKWDVPYVIQET